LPSWSEIVAEKERSYKARRLLWNIICLIIIVLIFLFFISPVEFADGIVVAIFLGLFLLTGRKFFRAPKFPNYLKLAFAIFQISYLLGPETSPENRLIIEREVSNISKLIVKQRPNLEDRDLVYHVALKTLQNLDELLHAIAMASGREIDSQTVAQLKKELSNLADFIFEERNLNDPNLDKRLDDILSTVRTLPVAATSSKKSKSKRIIEQINDAIVWSLKTQQRTFIIELMIAVAVSYYLRISLKLQAVETITLLFAFVTFEVVAEDRLIRVPSKASKE
jgi:hypothetical protein